MSTTTLKGVQQTIAHPISLSQHLNNEPMLQKPLSSTLAIYNCSTTTVQRQYSNTISAYNTTMQYVRMHTARIVMLT
jgi:hypothetical protein